MKRYALAILSWLMMIMLILGVDGIIRRSDPKFYEPRSDYTAGVTDGLFELLGSGMFVLLFITIIPMIIILWKKNPKHALIMGLVFLVGTTLMSPFALLLYACSTGIACI